MPSGHVCAVDDLCDCVQAHELQVAVLIKEIKDCCISCACQCAVQVARPLVSTASGRNRLCDCVQAHELQVAVLIKEIKDLKDKIEAHGTGAELALANLARVSQDHPSSAELQSKVKEQEETINNLKIELGRLPSVPACACSLSKHSSLATAGCTGMYPVR